MNEIKAGVAGTVDKNGKPGADQFKTVADQIRAAADQLNTGLREPLSDHNSIVLNQVFAQTRVPAAATPSDQPSAQSPQEAESKPGTTPALAVIPGVNGNLNRASADADTHAIDLVSAVGDPPDLTPPGSPTSQHSGAPPIIDLSSSAVDPSPLDRRPQVSSKPVIGASITLPPEASVGRTAERPLVESVANAAYGNPEGAEPSLGMYLLASREKRVATREDASRDTRIPAHYLRMMESNDYSMIADQLYLLPFLRRYAEYLGLDSEDIAIRFVREVQRAENSPGPSFPTTPVDAERTPSNLWAILGALAIIALIVGWMILRQRHHPGGDVTADVIPQHSAMPDNNAGPPLPETIQGSIQSDAPETAPSASSASASLSLAQGHPLLQPTAATHPSVPRHPNEEPIPPPGGTE